MPRPGQREGIMLCYPFDLRRFEKWGRRAYIQYKLNGERCRAICVGGQVKLYSSETNLVQFLPHVNEALKKLELDSVELDGELYHHGTSLQDIHSIVSRKVNPHEEAALVEYHIFDVIDTSLTQRERFTMLSIIDKAIKRCGVEEELKIVWPELVTSEQQIDSFLDQAISEGYEGFVLRHPENLYVRKRSTNLMKYKPHQEDVYEIVGVQEEVSITGTPKNSLGAFICRGDDGTLFNVGSGPTQENRKELWRDRDSLIGKHLKVKYQALSPGKRIPLHSVALNVLDLRSK